MIENRTILEYVGPASRAEWLSFCRSCPGATFFHTPFWAELFEQRYPGRFRAAPMLFRFHDNTNILLPMVIKRRLSGLVRIACSMPGNTFGGWISPTPLESVHEEAVMEHLNSYENYFLRENPYCPIKLPLANGVCRDDSTRTIGLTEGYDAVWMRATAGHRNAVRNAMRSGVDIREATDDGEWKAYFALYTASIDRWNKRRIFTGVRYDRSFFMRIRKTEPALRKLWLASVNGTFVAGILCFYWNRHAVVWHGAGLSEYFSYHPNNLLYDRAIAHAVESGYEWFDCNPSGGLPGVNNFKHYIGAKPMQSRLIVRRSPLIGCLDLVRRRQGAGP